MLLGFNWVLVFPRKGDVVAWMGAHIEDFVSVKDEVLAFDSDKCRGVDGDFVEFDRFDFRWPLQVRVLKLNGLRSF